MVISWREICIIEIEIWKTSHSNHSNHSGNNKLDNLMAHGCKFLNGSNHSQLALLFCERRWFSIVPDRNSELGWWEVHSFGEESSLDCLSQRSSASNRNAINFEWRTPFDFKQFRNLANTEESHGLRDHAPPIAHRNLNNDDHFTVVATAQQRKSKSRSIVTTMEKWCKIRKSHENWRSFVSFEPKIKGKKMFFLL